MAVFGSGGERACRPAGGFRRGWEADAYDEAPPTKMYRRKSKQTKLMWNGSRKPSRLSPKKPRAAAARVGQDQGFHSPPCAPAASRKALRLRLVKRLTGP